MHFHARILSLTLALVALFALGTVVQHALDGHDPDGVRPRAGPFQLLWLGQYAAFALALAITPAAALVAWLTGSHVPLRFTLPLAVAGLVGWYFARDGRMSRLTG